MCHASSDKALSAADVVEQIVISDDEEATVRSLQTEEDEALARSLQVGLPSADSTVHQGYSTEQAQEIEANMKYPRFN